MWDHEDRRPRPTDNPDRVPDDATKTADFIKQRLVHSVEVSIKST